MRIDGKLLMFVRWILFFFLCLFIISCFFIYSLFYFSEIPEMKAVAESEMTLTKQVPWRFPIKPPSHEKVVVDFVAHFKGKIKHDCET